MSITAIIPLIEIGAKLIDKLIPDVRIGDRHAAAGLQRGKRIASNDSVRIGDSRRIKAVLTTNYEVLVCFEMKIAVLSSHEGSKRALSATGQATQDDAIERE